MSEKKLESLGPAKAAINSEVQFDFIKGNQFRSIHADGVWGGVNGRLDITMAFYSERPSIPQRIVHPIIDGKLGNEILDKRVDRQAVIRDVDVSISMNVEAAKIFRKWLDDKISTVERIIQQVKETENE
jgi:hypothetical protein